MLKGVLIFVLFYNCVVLAKKHIPIGIILNEEQNEIETAFRSSIERINMGERSFEIVPIVKYVNINESYDTEIIACDLLERNVYAIFGPDSSESNGIVSSMSDTLDIPHILFHWKPEEPDWDRQERSMTINVYPKNSELSSAYADIVKRSFEWRGFAILYESDEGLIRLQDLFQIPEAFEDTVSATTLPDLYGGGVTKLLKRLKNSGVTTFIIDCSPAKIVQILQIAKMLDMMENHYKYFLTNMDTHSIEFNELKFVLANIYSARFFDPESVPIQSIVYEWEQKQSPYGIRKNVSPKFISAKTIFIYEAVKTFAAALKDNNLVNEITPPLGNCLRTTHWASGREIMANMKFSTTEGITSALKFNEYGERTYFEVHLIQLKSHGFENMAIWTPQKRIHRVQEEIEIEAKEILKHRTVVVSTRIGSPYFMERERQHGEYLHGNDRYEGFTLDLFEEIATMLDFKFQFKLVPDQRYGAYNPDTKKWDGIIGDVLYKKADVGVADLVITQARRSVVDFTTPFMDLGVSILYNIDVQRSGNMFMFLSPFRWEIWIYIISLYAAISLLLHFLTRISPREWGDPKPHGEHFIKLRTIWNLPNTAWLSMGSLTWQGCNLMPKGLSTRLLTAFWWLCTFIVINFYTANLIIHLIDYRDTVSSDFKDVGDLAAQTKVKYGMIDGGSTMQFIKESSVPTYKKMWNTIENDLSVLVKSNEEGIERVLGGKGSYAFLMESVSLEYAVERNCKLIQVGDTINSRSYGIALPFNSPLRTYFNKAILKLKESGKITELRRKWWKEKYNDEHCPIHKEMNIYKSALGIENLGGLFLILGLGIMIAFSIGMLEFLLYVRDLADEEDLPRCDVFKKEFRKVLLFWKPRDPNERRPTQIQEHECPTPAPLPEEPKPIEGPPIRPQFVPHILEYPPKNLELPHQRLDYQPKQPEPESEPPPKLAQYAPLRSGFAPTPYPTPKEQQPRYQPIGDDKDSGRLRVTFK